MKKQILLSVVLLAACSTEVLALRGGGGKTPPAAAPVNTGTGTGTGTGSGTVTYAALPGVTTVAQLQSAVQGNQFKSLTPLADIAAAAQEVAASLAVGGNPKSDAGLTATQVMNG